MSDFFDEFYDDFYDEFYFVIDVGPVSGSLILSLASGGDLVIGVQVDPA